MKERRKGRVAVSQLQNERTGQGVTFPGGQLINNAAGAQPPLNANKLRARGHTVPRGSSVSPGFTGRARPTRNLIAARTSRFMTAVVFPRSLSPSFLPSFLHSSRITRIHPGLREARAISPNLFSRLLDYAVPGA